MAELTIIPCMVITVEPRKKAGWLAGNYVGTGRKAECVAMKRTGNLNLRAWPGGPKKEKGWIEILPRVKSNIL